MRAGHKTEGLTRRSLLKSLGVVAGAAIIAPARLQGSEFGSGGFGNQLRIGVLQDARAPGTKEFLAGVRVGGAREVVLASTSERAGIAGLRAELSRLLDNSNVDVVIGRMNPLAAERLYDVLETRGGIMVVADIGERVRSEPSSALFRSSLGYADSCWTLGAWGAAQVGRRVLVVASMEEAGHEAIVQFQRGVEASRGTVVDTLIVDGPHETLSPDEIILRTHAHNPDLIALFVPSFVGAAIADRLHTTGMGTLPVVASPFTLGERGISRAFLGAYSLYGWNPAHGPTPGNLRFVQQYREMMGETPGTSALLGFKTTRLVASAAGNNRSWSRDRVTTLRSAPVDGSGGAACIDHTPTRRVHIGRAVNDGGAGTIVLTLVDTPPVPRPTFVERCPGGWTTPYQTV